MIDRRTLPTSVLLFVTATAVLAGQRDPLPAQEETQEAATDAQSDREALYREFSENLTDVALVGTYTTTSQGDDEKPKPDRYQISKVTKLKNDFWLFHAKYGEISMPPLPLEVLWAGRTPVITMDEFTIPLLGTFSFRVLIDGDLYVGTWVHDEKRGHMLGRIEPIEKPSGD